MVQFGTFTHELEAAWAFDAAATALGLVTLLNFPHQVRPTSLPDVPTSMTSVAPTSVPPEPLRMPITIKYIMCHSMPWMFWVSALSGFELVVQFSTVLPCQ